MDGAAASGVRPRRLVHGLAGACHPVPTVVVTTVAVVLAVGIGLPPGRVVGVGVAVLTGQLSIGWSNDVIDASRDIRAGRADKPVATGGVPLPVVARAAALALVATVVLSLLLGPRAGAAALTLVAAGWAYNLGLKGTVASAATYLIGFAALPVVPYLASAEPVWPPWWVPATGALLGFSAHFANALPDLRADRETGVHGLPQRWGAPGGVVAMAASLAGASVVLGFGPASRSTAFAVTASTAGIILAAAVVVAAVRAPHSTLAFRLTLLIAVLDVGLLIGVAG